MLFSMPSVRGILTERYTMFDWIKKLFGHGHIYADFVCEDGTIGHSKAPYIGDTDTFDLDKYSEHLKAEI